MQKGESSRFPFLHFEFKEIIYVMRIYLPGI